MKIVFTKHAKIKLRHRRVEKKLVENALSSPDFFRPSYGNREVAYKKVGRSYLAVVFRRENGSYIVITEHWVAKLKRDILK